MSSYVIEVVEPESVRPSGFTIPAEFDPQKRCWLIWPYNPQTWPQQARPAREAFAEVIRAICGTGQDVTLVARPEDSEEVKKVFSDLLQVEAGHGRLDILEAGSGDAWARDTLPTFAAGGDGIDWTFNGYGGNCYTDWVFDDSLPEIVLKTPKPGAGPDGSPRRRYRSPLVTEGGALDFNGAGAVLVTAESVLNINRNPDLGKSNAERLLRAACSVEDVIWIPRGLSLDVDTDGHVDNLARFVCRETVALAWTDDPRSADYYVVRDAEKALQIAGLVIKKIPLPRHPVLVPSEAAEEGIRVLGGVLPASYANFLILNKAVLVPAFGGDNAESDEIAVNILKELFPTREIIQIKRATDILVGGGNVHCIVQTEYE